MLILFNEKIAQLSHKMPTALARVLVQSAVDTKIR
jgi:transcriptional regulator of acetoin/glycerol metabolism